MVEEYLGEGPDDGNVIEHRELEGQEAALGRECGRAAALLEPLVAQHHGQACGQHVDGDARHHLIAALVDRGIAMHQREGERGEDGAEQADPG